MAAATLQQLLLLLPPLMMQRQRQQWQRLHLHLHLLLAQAQAQRQRMQRRCSLQTPPQMPWCLAARHQSTSPQAPPAWELVLLLLLRQCLLLRWRPLLLLPGLRLLQKRAAGPWQGAKLPPAWTHVQAGAQRLQRLLPPPPPLLPPPLLM